MDELAPDEQSDTGPLGEIAMMGVCVTFTVTELVALHPLVVPVTVYVVGALRLLAVGLDTDVELNPVAGLHVYVVAPFACSEVDELAPDEQSAIGPVGVIAITGVCVMLTLTVVEALQLPVYPVTV